MLENDFDMQVTPNSDNVIVHMTALCITLMISI